MSNKGMIVRVDYTGYVQGGERFGSSKDTGKPMEFQCSANQAFPAIDEAVETMAIGEQRTIAISAAEAFGEYSEANIVTIPSSSIGGGTSLPIGEVFQMLDGNSKTVSAKVIAVDKEAKTVTLDYNHPLAGKDLVYEIELLEVVDPAEAAAQRNANQAGLQGAALAAALSAAARMR